MGRLCVCREYEDMFTEGYKYIESLEEHDTKVRADAIDELIDSLPYSALIRKSTIVQLADALKEQNNG